MHTQKRNLLFGAALAVAAMTVSQVWADNTNLVTFRTTGYFVGLAQGSNSVSGKPSYENISFAGHNLVNLEMGRSLTDTNHPSQVLAMTFECDLSSASLVVYDLATSNLVAVIGAGTVSSVVRQQDLGTAAGPNRAHFVTTVQLDANGNSTNGVTGGYFTIAGRVNLDPVTGCPKPVVLILDRDSLDKVDDDLELPEALDADTVRLTSRTGLAHLIGVADIVTSGYSHTVLVPYGGLSIRRELPLQ
jgi:hypothetical protein